MGKGKSDLQMTMVSFKSGMGSCIKYTSLLLIAIAAVFVCSGMFIEPDTTRYMNAHSCIRKHA
jgi:hypothetical protein